MFDNSYQAAGRAAEYLSDLLGDSPFEYIPDYPPNYVSDTDCIGGLRIRYDSFTRLCLDAVDGPIERVWRAVNGNGLGDDFCVIDGLFEGASDKLACELEVPAAALSPRHALSFIQYTNHETSARIANIEVCADKKRLLMSYSGGGEISINEMAFSCPSETSRKLASGIYRNLRDRDCKMFSRLSRIAGLKGSPCFDHLRTPSTPPYDENEWPPSQFKQFQITRDRKPRKDEDLGRFVFYHPRNVAREFQRLWKVRGGDAIALSRCQEAIARFFGAKNWQHLTSIDADSYSYPVVLSIGTDPRELDCWTEHHYYRNAIDGLAGFIDLIGSKVVDEWTFDSGYGVGLTITARVGTKYFQVRNFTMMLDDEESSREVPATLSDIRHPRFMADAMTTLNVGISHQAYLDKRDDESGSISLVIEDLQIRRCPVGEYSERKTYVVVERIRPDGSLVRRLGVTELDKALLLKNAETNVLEIYEKEFNGPPSLIASLPRGLRESDEARLFLIFRTEWERATSLDELLEDQEITRKVVDGDYEDLL